MKSKPTYQELEEELESYRQKLELKKSEEKFRDPFENSGDAILILENERFADCNQAAVEMLMYNTKAQLLDIHPSKLSPEIQADGRNSIEKADEMMKIALKKGTHRFEWDHVKNNGEIINVEVLLTVISDEANKRVIHSVLHDITDHKKTQQAFKESQAKFSSIVENITGVFYSHTPDHTFTYVSPQVEEILGYTRQEALICWTDFTSGNQINEEGFRKTVAAIESGITQPPYELEMVHKNGKKVMVEVREKPIVENGQTISIVGIFTDISERKQSEKKIRAANKELLSTTDALKKSNAELKLALEKAGKSEKLEAANKKLVENEQHLKKLNEELSANEEVLHHLNEELKTSNEYVEKQYEQIENHKNRLRAILDNSNAVIYVKDLQGKYLIINKRYENLFNITEKKIIGKTDFDLFPREIANKITENDKKILKEKNPLEFEEIIEHEDGLHTYLSMKFLIYNDKNKAYAVGGISTDITERKIAEANLMQKSKELNALNLDYKKQNQELSITKELAESANEAKSRFLANMSHEIRTPMNAILGFSEILEKKIKNPELEQYLSAISSSGKALNLLISDILDLSRIEAAKISISYSAVDLQKFIEGIVLIFTKKIDEKGLDFIKEIDAALPEYVIIDEIRVKQIIFNLLNNAVKFTFSGYVKLRIQLLKKTEALCSLQFSVADTGIGIPLNQQKVIFKPFRQQKNQSHESFGGTGLGLSISKGLAERMDGEILLKSEPDEGSEFTLTLKNVEITDVSKIKAKTDFLSGKTIMFEKATILIAEDIKLNRDLLISYIRDFDFSIIEAENGQIAVDLAIKNLPQLILMDIRMPVLNGLDAIRILKSDKRTKHIPIIVITASSTEDAKKEIEKVCDHYLGKPVSSYELISTMGKHLKHSIKDDETKAETITKIKVKGLENINNPDELYNLLKENVEPKWNIIKNTLIINEIIDLADYIIKNYKHYNYNKLLNWASELKSQAQVFDLDAVEKTIDLFPVLLKELLAQLKNRALKNI
ncbi:MAG: PAS domain S-box protein [Bacteroidota bacterium]